MRVLLALLVAALFPAMLAAQPAAPQAAAAPRELATSFDPPLNKPLLYRVTQERNKAGKAETMTMVQEVTYRRDGAGVVMTLRPLQISNAGKMLDLTARGTPIPPTLRPLLEAVEIDLDADGAILRMRDWESFKTRLEASVPALAAEAEPDPKKREQAKAFFRQFFAKYLAVGSEGAPQLMLKGWPDMLGVMGAAGPEGKDQIIETEVVTPFSPEPIRTLVTMRITQPESAGVLRIDVISAPDPDAIKQLIRALVDTMSLAAPADKPVDRAAMERELAGMSVTMTMVVELDARSGTLRRGVSERHVTMAEGSGIDRLTIEAQ